MFERAGRQQEMTGQGIEAHEEKDKGKNLMWEEEKARQNIKIFLTKVQTEVEVIRHSWRHPLHSISD